MTEQEKMAQVVIQLREALAAVIDDLKLRSNLKRGEDKGLLDISHGVYTQARYALRDSSGTYISLKHTETTPKPIEVWGCVLGEDGNCKLEECTHCSDNKNPSIRRVRIRGYCLKCGNVDIFETSQLPGISNVCVECSEKSLIFCYIKDIRHESE